MSWTYQSWGTEYPRIAVDLTGNHAADILGFGYDGVWVSLNDGNGNFSPPNIGITDFCIATGWSIEKHVRMVANLTDSGYPDIIGFGNAGVYVSKGNGDGTFLPAELVVANFGYDQAWRVEEHPRYVVDLNGNGKADIIGFGNDGVWTAMNKGDGTFYPAQYILADFGVNQGWRVEKHLRYLADLDGDGKPEIIGIGDAGVYVAMNKGDGTFYPVKMGLVGLGYNQGWRVNKHIRLVGDVLGIGKASIVAAREDGEVLVAWGIGNGTFQIPRPAGVSLGYLNQYFQSDPTIDFSSYLVFLADVIGNGQRQQLIAFGDTRALTVDFTDLSSSPFFATSDFGFNTGWKIGTSIRTVANIGGVGKAGIVGFGDAGIYTAMSKGDDTFLQPANFMLADFGRISGRVVSSITVDFHMTGDDLDDDTQLHIFIKNRKSDTSDSGDPGSLAQHIQNYADAENNWFEKNPYLGCALYANVGGGFADGDTKRVNILLRKKPIPVEELNLPQIIIFIIPKGNDTWKFEYTVTITLDDGTQLPPFGSNVNGITGIIMDQDNPSYSGIGTELNPTHQPTKPQELDKGPLLSRATIEFKTHNNDKSSSTAVNIHIVNRKSALESQDISVVSDIATNQYFDDPSDHIFELPIAANDIFLHEIVLPVVYIHIIPKDDDETWIFDYIVTFYFGNSEPYAWNTSGVILENGHPKHMGVYSGRPVKNNPQASLTLSPIVRHKTISLAYVNQKLNEFLLSRQVKDSPDPLIKININNTE